MAADTLDAVIVGGGISGLTLGYALSQKGLSVVVLEAKDYPGGTIHSVRKDGFLVEHGPNTGLLTQKAHLELFDAIGLQNRLALALETADYRYVLRKGQLILLPTSLGGFLKTPLFSPWAKLKVTLEPFHKRAKHEETLAGFVTRRLGREFLDYAIDPFVSGVYAGDPEKLSVKEAFPKLYALEERYGGLILGTILGARERKKRGETAKFKARLFSFLEGMSELPNSLADKLGDRLLTKAHVQGLKVTNGGFETHFLQDGTPQTLFSKRLILSVPAYEASRLLKDLDDGLALRLEAIPYPPVAQIALGYRLEAFETPIKGFGFLIPKREGRKILGALFNSSFLPNRAPEGFALLTAFLGGMRSPNLALKEKDELVQIAHQELKDILKLKQPPSFIHAVTIERAIPQYTLDHGSVVGAIEAIERRLKGFHILANYRGGIALGDCLKNALCLAESMLSEKSASQTRL